MRTIRLLSIAAVALGGLLGAAQAASATSAPAHPAAAHAHGDLPGAPTRSAPRTAAPRSVHGGVSLADTTTPNWAGYVASGQRYLSVSSSWIVPWVTCLSNGADGTAAFWVGLDGFNTSTVEQTGIAVDCSSGNPHLYAWWETFPQAPVVYGNTVGIGDSVTATVTAISGSQVDLKLVDNSQGWTQNTIAATPAGAGYDTAEIIAEAATNAGTGSVETLPDYGVVPFTGSTIAGASLQSEGAFPVDMTNSGGSVVSSTAPADASGDFNVFYGTSDNPATFYDCGGGLYDSTVGVLMSVGGCTGPYGSTSGEYIVNIVSMTQPPWAGGIEGVATVYCTDISISGGSGGGGDCPWVQGYIVV
jgi:peptidase A4-like protein